MSDPKACIESSRSTDTRPANGTYVERNRYRGGILPARSNVRVHQHGGERRRSGAYLLGSFPIVKTGRLFTTSTVGISNWVFILVSLPLLSVELFLLSSLLLWVVVTDDPPNGEVSNDRSCETSSRVLGVCDTVWTCSLVYIL